jgi:hypothetical protein
MFGFEALAERQYNVRRTDDVVWWGERFPPSQERVWAVAIECHYRSVTASDASKLARRRHAETKHRDVLEWVRDHLDNSQIVWDQYIDPFPRKRKHFNRLMIYFGDDTEASAFKIMWQ